MTKRLTQGRKVTTVEPPSAELIERVLLSGDLSQLNPAQRLEYYKNVCRTLGLNPLTKPFDYIVLDSKLVLYARKDCTEQLRKLYNISLKIMERGATDSVYTVTAQAKLGKRVDESIGAVPLEVVKDGKTLALTAAARANAVMKAETKAKRRVTLSICGLGMMDESEIELAEYSETQPETVHENGNRMREAVIERNVKEATANATGEPAPKQTEPVTAENYKDVICHIGKAEGNILGKKVGLIHPKIIEWLVTNWIAKLPPSPTDQDWRLRDAVILAHAENQKSKPDASAAPTPTEQPVTQDTGSRQAAMTDLRGRIEDLVLTEEQFVAYLMEEGVSDQKWTKLDDMPDSMLLYLCTPKAWATATDSIKAKLKPKVDPAPPKKRGRSK